MERTVLHLDPFSGMSGDMLVGALLDLGLELDDLRAEVGKLGMDGYRLESAAVTRGGIAGRAFRVILEAHVSDRASQGHHRHEHGPHKHDSVTHHSHRHFADIRKMIGASSLSSRVKQQSLKAFSLLAEVEGRVHHRPADQVAFHEVGAVDSIVDMVGFCAGLEVLGIEELWCGPLALGGDGDGGAYVECAHGKLPIPAFATLELAKGLPLRRSGVDRELTTPTGAALVKALATRFGPLSGMNVERIGYGAGSRDDPGIPIPNILRAALGTSRATLDAEECDTIVELQANLDDTTPEVLGFLTEHLLAEGALDVFHTAVQMKKSRPGLLLTVLAPPARFDALVERIFRETPTFGLRYETRSRMKLSREFRTVSTAYGDVRVKIGSWRGRFMSAHPEYEDCRRIAGERNVPLRHVIEAARSACGPDDASSAGHEADVDTLGEAQ